MGAQASSKSCKIVVADQSRKLVYFTIFPSSVIHTHTRVWEWEHSSRRFKSRMFLISWNISAQRIQPVHAALSLLVADVSTAVLLYYQTSKKSQHYKWSNLFTMFLNRSTKKREHLKKIIGKVNYKKHSLCKVVVTCTVRGDFWVKERSSYI